jgi:hypothetical protein
LEGFLQLGPSKAVKIFQILNLIKQSVSIFGNKMDMGQNQEVILASHGHRQINPCLQGLILVKFARLTLPLNPSSSNTWIKRLVPFVQSIFLKFLQCALFIKTEDLGVCEYLPYLRYYNPQFACLLLPFLKVKKVGFFFQILVHLDIQGIPLPRVDKHGLFADPPPPPPLPLLDHLVVEGPLSRGRGKKIH